MKPGKKKNANEENIADVMAASAPVFEELPVRDLFPSPTNPRKLFKEEALKELSGNIKKYGLIQPISVRPVQKKGKDLQYEIVAGERRYRACVLAGKETMTCRVTNYTDAEVLEIQIAENLHRDNVTAMEEADGFYNLTHMKKNSLTVAEIAVRIGKSERYIYERISLRDLIPEAQDLIDKDHLSLKHGLFLGRFPNHIQKRTLGEIVKKDFQGNILTVAPIEVAKKFINNIILDLTKVKWDYKEANMCGNLPSCTQCTLRTGYNTLLFNDIAKEDYCLNADCFKLKGNESLLRLQQQLVEEEEKPVVFITKQYYYDETSNDKSDLFDADILEDDDEKSADQTKAVYSTRNYTTVDTKRADFIEEFGEEAEFPEALIRKAIVVDGKEAGEVQEVIIDSEYEEYIETVVKGNKLAESEEEEEDDDDDDDDDDDNESTSVPKLSWPEKNKLNDRYVAHIIKNAEALLSDMPLNSLRKNVKSDFENLIAKNQGRILTHYQVEFIEEENKEEKFAEYVDQLDPESARMLHTLVSVIYSIQVDYSLADSYHTEMGLALSEETAQEVESEENEPLF